ncbi:troponin T-like isoform X3 [Physella acuta]|uniref:troponin T-like isoform X3 n=1 Tax=Physella acuta TaxID=109671 RepID=UPI0027DAE887|nr:troponin T-like isoform X3 [Physella acuta]
MSEEEQTVEAGGEEEAPAQAAEESTSAEHHEERSHEFGGDQNADDANEAKRAMEEAKRARLEKQAADLAEYEEMRKAEKVKEEEEIRNLREKRIQRQKERAEEEKRLAEYRAQEEVRRKADEEERRRKKQDEETRVKDEREKKKKEAEERLKPKGRNFKISKKSDSEKGGSDGLDSIMSKEELQKSKEQLEEEKQAILAQRIQPLSIDGLASDKLIEKAKELNDHIKRLEGDKYDLEQRFKRQQYDMIELAERARQMNKGKAKRGVTTVQVDESFDRLADKFTSAPPKIQLCSKYERHTDHRSYKERMVLFEDLAKEPPPPEIKRVGKVTPSPAAEDAE